MCVRVYIGREREGGERLVERWVYGEIFYIYICVCVLYRERKRGRRETDVEMGIWRDVYMCVCV